MTKLLITGGAGFVGSHTVEEALKRGYDILIIDNLSTGSLENLSGIVDNERVELARIDIRLREKLEEAVKGIDSVIHLAAIVSVEEALARPREAVEVNVLGTLNVLEIARRLDVEKLVYASSVAVYGEPKSLPIAEDHLRDPANLYGCTKLAGELLVESYSRDYGLRSVVLRYFNVYGPRMKRGPYAGAVYKFMEAALLGRSPVIYGDGEQTRDFVYVEDVAKANLDALESSATGVFNVGTGRATKIIELCNLILELVGRADISPVYTSPRPGDVKQSMADITRIMRELKWRPRVELREGLERTLEWMRKRLKSLPNSSPTEMGKRIG